MEFIIYHPQDIVVFQGAICEYRTIHAFHSKDFVYTTQDYLRKANEEEVKLYKQYRRKSPTYEQ